MNNLNPVWQALHHDGSASDVGAQCLCQEGNLFTFEIAANDHKVELEALPTLTGSPRTEEVSQCR